MLQVALTTIGSLVAFGLAGLRLYEFVRDRRPRISAHTILRSLPDMGNTITLLNSGKVPAGIYNFTLVWVEPHWTNWLGSRFRRVNNEESMIGFDQTCDITVDPYSQYSLEFSENDHFDWGGDLESDIYLKLWVVGRRKPLWLWITGPVSRVFARSNDP